MDNKSILQQFDKIEIKVKRLVESCKSLEATNIELLNKIERLEKDLQNKAEEENRYAEVKALIRSKIDSLMARLDGSTEAD